MITATLFLVGLLFQQPSGLPTEDDRPKPDATVKLRLQELVRLYKDAAKEIARQKSTATRDDVAEKRYQEFVEWIDQREDERWQLTAKIRDIKKEADEYFAITDVPRQFSAFSAQANKPVVAQSITLLMSPEQRAELKTGDMLQITGELVVDEMRFYSEGFDVLEKARINKSPILKLEWRKSSPGQPTNMAVQSGPSYPGSPHQPFVLILTNIEFKKHEASSADPKQPPK